MEGALRVTVTGAFLLAAALSAAASSNSAPPAPIGATPIRATGSVELDDPAGDVGPIETGIKEERLIEPAFDMVHLSIASDGRRLTIRATLTAPPGAHAGRAVDVYFDTDNDATTGVSRVPGYSVGGFEYVLHLDSCVDYDDGRGSCVAARVARPFANYGSVRLARYRSRRSHDLEDVLDDETGRPKLAVRTPVTGTILTGVVDYEDLKVRPGQTIRIVAGEWTKRKPGTKRTPALCPEILLTLE
jgi:hypothetical protein